jgi:hypothetical protein
VRADADIVAAEMVLSDQSMAALNGQILLDGALAQTRLYSAQLATVGGSYFDPLEPRESNVIAGSHHRACRE